MGSLVKKLKQKLRSRKKKEEERWFLENGSIFLEELIADCNGDSIPIRSFSSDQILKATNNFDSSCFLSQDALFERYRGRIEDRSYMIKRFTENGIIESGASIEEVYNGIALSARMSNHNNFLKLLGCCLEFPFPVLVFEYAEHGVLNRRGDIIVNGEDIILPWSVRLKIAKEIANAVTYLHMAFPEIIIHREVKPMHVFVDKNWTAKLSDLSFAISLPEGKSTVETQVVVGTPGYLDPFYYETRFVTEYTDVYSFGICLLVFLTGKSALVSGSDGKYQGVLIDYVRELCENGTLNEVIDPMIIEDITSAQELQLGACVRLALRCCEERDEDRPKMIQVAKELKRIQTSAHCSLPTI